MQALGELTACYQNVLSGRETPVLQQKNLILYDAADIMAQLLAGNMNLAISQMYLEYENSNAGLVGLSPALRGDNYSYYNGIVPTGGNYHDFLRTPILTNGKITQVPAGSANYAGNAVTFSTSSGATAQLGQKGEQFGYGVTHGTSNVKAVALVSSPAPANPALDKIFSRVVLSSPLAMQSGFNLTFYWMLKFN